MFRVTESGTLRGNGGEAIHGWLFKRLHDLNPKASERIHNQQHKPFALSGLILSKKEYPQGYQLKCSIYVFASGDTELVMEACHSSIGIGERLGNMPVIVESSRVVQSTTFAHIIEEAFSLNHSIFVVEFLTPTSFRSQGKQILYPSSELVLRSLSARWNTFCNERMPKSDMNWDNVLWISQFNLRTESITFGNYQIVGSVGRVKYIPARVSQNSFDTKMAHALLKFGNFCGVGYKTTMGLGKIRY